MIHPELTIYAEDKAKQFAQEFEASQRETWFIAFHKGRRISINGKSKWVSVRAFRQSLAEWLTGPLDWGWMKDKPEAKAYKSLSDKEKKEYREEIYKLFDVKDI